MAKAYEVPLMTYLELYEPHELVRVSPNEYCTQTHDSLRITPSNGLWHWASRGVGGNSAYKYLREVKDLSFHQAMERLVPLTGVAYLSDYNTPTRGNRGTSKAETKPKILKLPPRSQDNYRAISYLQKRGIDSEIIDHCTQNNLIYDSKPFPDKPYRNVVFVGYDKHGKARAGSVRATYEPKVRIVNGKKIKPFKTGDVSGTDKRFSFFMPANSFSEHTQPPLIVCESAIDTLSCATIAKAKGRDWKAMHYLSLSGIAVPSQDNDKAKDELPLALEKRLSDMPEVKKIALMLDNDRAGLLVGKHLSDVLTGKGYSVSVHFPPQIKGSDKPPKDWNEWLVMRLETAKSRQTNPNIQAKVR